MNYFNNSIFSVLKNSFPQKNQIGYIYLFSNLYVAFLGFIRSSIFIYLYNFEELGSITILMTSSGLSTLLQLGVINGGYRIIAASKSDDREKVNNVVFTYLFLVSILVIFSVIVIGFLGIIKFNSLSAFFVLTSIAGFISNWISNRLIGESNFGKLNIANITSSTISICIIFLTKWLGILAAFFSISLQPVLFILFVSAMNFELLPKKIDFDLKYLKYILSYGFIPFLSGLFFIIYQQVERWSINAFLGRDSLGKMYLVFLTINIWSLIPSSINNYFFPKAVSTYTESNINSFNNAIAGFYKVMIIYSLSVSFFILLLLKPSIEIFLPKYLPYKHLVIFVLPALFFKNMCEVYTLYLNSVGLLKPIFWSDILSTTAYVICISLLFIFNMFTLERVVINFCLYNFIKLIVLFSYYRRKKYQLNHAIL